MYLQRECVDRYKTRNAFLRLAQQKLLQDHHVDASLVVAKQYKFRKQLENQNAQSGSKFHAISTDLQKINRDTTTRIGKVINVCGKISSGI
jgi:hypothetical protein